MANLKQSNTVSRRQLIQGTAVAGAMAVAGIRGTEGAVVKNGQINQSVVKWCFMKHWTLTQTAEIAKKLGCKSVELAGPEDWPTLKKYGLACAIAPSHLFVQGMNNPKYQEACIELLKTRIDDCADAGFPTVISFTGYAKETGEWADGGVPGNLAGLMKKDAPVIEPDEGIKNCVAAFKKVVGYAEEKKVNISLEMLNTREDSNPMKGHPGYQGDHIDYCMEIINQVGSPRFGLLFDIYHVQIMDGDIIRRIKQCGEAINHVHTAGNPGRGELDETQEINYPPCMRALIEIGYTGYVGQEFIPTRDPLGGLTQAVKLCDV